MIPLTHSAFNFSNTLSYPIGFLSIGGGILCLLSLLLFILSKGRIGDWLSTVLVIGSSCLGLGLVCILAVTVIQSSISPAMSNFAPTHQKSLWSVSYVTPSQEQAWFANQHYKRVGEDTQGNDLYQSPKGKIHANCQVSYKDSLVKKGDVYYAQPFVSCDN